MHVINAALTFIVCYIVFFNLQLFKKSFVHDFLVDSVTVGSVVAMALSSYQISLMYFKL